MSGHLGGWKLMPAPADTCPQCAIKHEADQPHNQQSMAYQYRFFNEHGRWPTWTDAMAHCPEDVKAFWSKTLTELGAKLT